MQPTRWEILQLLKKRGRATVDELSRALDMTLMGVRLHLVVLDRDGYVRRSTVREKPGRPALVYSLTQKAEELFPKRYDLLAEKLLEALHLDCSESAGAILEAAARGMAAPLAGQLAGTPLHQRVEEIGRALDGVGTFASWERVDAGYLLHNYNCLFYSVAQRNREVCSMDGVFLKEILGVEVEQTECLLDGAPRCSFFVPASTQD
ncbi:MAG: helix-turn-helix transcriptional regulator [Chloroflexota bacterium]